MTLQEYLKTRDTPKEFKPHFYYNEMGDTIHVYIEDVDAYTETLCDGVDVMRCMKTKRVVGVKILNVKRGVVSNAKEAQSEASQVKQTASKIT